MFDALKLKFVKTPRKIRKLAKELGMPQVQQRLLAGVLKYMNTETMIRNWAEYCQKNYVDDSLYPLVWTGAYIGVYRYVGFDNQYAFIARDQHNGSSIDNASRGKFVLVGILPIEGDKS